MYCWSEGVAKPNSPEFRSIVCRAAGVTLDKNNNATKGAVAGWYLSFSVVI